MRLAQWVDGEGVGWCSGHSNTFHAVNRIRAVWPHPLQGTIEFTHGESDSTYEGIGLSSYWTCSYSGDGYSELRVYEERKKGVNEVLVMVQLESIFFEFYCLTLVSAIQNLTYVITNLGM